VWPDFQTKHHKKELPAVVPNAQRKEFEDFFEMFNVKKSDMVSFLQMLEK
jgi:hypothetical protein